MLIKEVVDNYVIFNLFFAIQILALFIYAKISGISNDSKCLTYNKRMLYLLYKK
jgi:hypothetical protein